MRVGFDWWTVITDARWTSAYAKLGPEDADPFEFRLRMPSLRVPGLAPPRDVDGSARVSREALARRCTPERLRARVLPMIAAAEARLRRETASGELLSDAFGMLLRCTVDMTTVGLLGDDALVELPDTLADDYRTVERALTVRDLFLPPVASPRAWAAGPARRRIARALHRWAAGARARGEGDFAAELLEGAHRRGLQADAAIDEVAWTLNSVHWAAHRYPAVHAFWIGVEMQQRPQLLARLLDEQRRIATLDGDTLGEAQLLRGCVLEGLRLHPLLVLPRRLRRPLEIEGYRLATGEVIVLSPYLAHHDLSVLADADQFDPDRWAPGGPGVPRAAFIPGGVGRWGCVGMRMTVQMLTALWSVLLRSHGWELLDAIPSYRHGPIIRPPANDLRVRLVPRA